MKEWNKYDKKLFLLVLFLGFGNIGGALAPTRLLAIVFLPLLLEKWKSCKYIKPFFIFFVFFYAFCLLSMMWTPDRTQGLKELVYYPIHFIYFFEILTFSRYARNPLKSLSWGWAIMIFLCSFIALWEISTDQHLSMAVQKEGEMSNMGNYLVSRLTASVTFANPNSYVTVLCYSFPWIIYLTLLENKKLYQTIILLFTVIASIVVIMFNMSRGGLLSFIIMGGVFFLLSKKSFWKSILYVFIAGFVIYILVNYGSQVFAIMEARTSDGGLTHDDARFSIWIVCLRILVSTLFVGIGVGGITAALYSASKNIVASPHSLFFEMLVQYGVIFTAVVVVFILRLFMAAWQMKETNRRTVLLMSLLALPVYTIINSGYLLGGDFFALIATIYVFIHLEKMQACIEKRVIKLPIQ